MSINDFVIAITNKGARVHRGTCTRIPSSAEMIGLVNADQYLKGISKLASCCKPRGALVYLDSAPEQETVTEKPVSTPEKEDPAPAPALSAEDIDTALKATEENSGIYSICAKDYRVSKHYWATFGAQAAEMVATTAGTTVEWDKNTGTAVFAVGENGLNARRNLDLVWTEGWAEFRSWRRTDEDYKSLPSQDTRWVTSDRYRWEREWLMGYVHGFLEEVLKDETVASERGYFAAAQAVL